MTDNQIILPAPRRVYPVSLILAMAFTAMVPDLATAGDSPGEGAARTPAARTQARAAGTVEYTTSADNDDNRHSGSPDGDMDWYLFNNYGYTPVEFTIDVMQPTGTSPVLLQINAFDVDSQDGEVDAVSVNGVVVGNLEGHPQEPSVTEFVLPPGLVVQGTNQISIDVDVDNPNAGVWGVTIESGTLILQESTVIQRAWATPVRVRRTGAVAFRAEVTGPCDYVEVYRGGDTEPLAKLTDADGDGTFTARIRIGRRAPLGTEFIQMRAFTIGSDGEPMERAHWPSRIPEPPPPPDNGGGT